MSYLNVCGLELADELEVEILTSNDGSTFSECHSVVCEKTTTTLLDLSDKAAKCGLPHQAQRVVIMPVDAFTTEDINALRAKLHGEVTEHTPREYDDVLPIQGFVPPAKQAETKPLRSQMEALLESAARHNGVLSQDQRSDLQQLSADARSMLRNAKMEAPVSKAVYRTVVYQLRSAYRDVYTSVHELIRGTEREALERLDALVHNTMGLVERPAQNTHDLATLLENGFHAKANFFDPFFTGMANTDPKLKFLNASLKGIWRIVEKMELRKEPTESCASICDVVRGAVCANSIAALASVYEHMQTSDRIQIIRVKNRLKEANDSGWADCLVNFVFVDDPARHICEVQLVHNKMMLVRKNMGAHSSYSFFRTANEMLESTDTDGFWQEECVLADLYYKCNGDGWVKRNAWCSAAPVSDWQGLKLNAFGHVVQIKLSANNLVGNFYTCTEVIESARLSLLLCS
jgi:hypothetical protein